MLSAVETETLEEILQLVEDNPDALNEWETGFMKSQKIRYEQYGEGTRISPKQWNVLKKIERKLNDPGQ